MDETHLHSESWNQKGSWLGIPSTLPSSWNTRCICGPDFVQYGSQLSQNSPACRLNLQTMCLLGILPTPLYLRLCGQFWTRNGFQCPLKKDADFT